MLFVWNQFEIFFLNHRYWKNERAFEGNLCLQGSQHFLSFDGIREYTNFVHDLVFYESQVKLCLFISSLICDTSLLQFRQN